MLPLFTTVTISLVQPKLLAPDLIKIKSFHQNSNGSENATSVQLCLHRQLIPVRTNWKKTRTVLQLI